MTFTAHTEWQDRSLRTTARLMWLLMRLGMIDNEYRNVKLFKYRKKIGIDK
jgi:hypothetical protein